MTDTKNPGDKTLHVSPKTLSLKRPVEQGMVRQSFSHGRSKAVVVETVKRRAGAGPGRSRSSQGRAAAGARARRALRPAGAAPQGRARPAAAPLERAALRRGAAHALR